MEKKNLNGVKGLANHNWSVKDEIIAGYNSTKGIKFANNPEFIFIWKNEKGKYHIFFEKDYGMWQVTVCRNWESRHNPGEVLLDRRACNLTPDYKTMRWSNKVVDMAAELIETAIA